MNISRILILVLLSTFVLNVGLGTALQSTVTLNNGTIISYVYGDEIDDGSTIDFAVNSVNLASEEYILHSVYSSVPPTIDGSFSLNEWGEPAIVDTLTYTNDSVNYETHDMFVYFMNDNNYLYIAVKITNDDYESDLNGDWDTFEIWFDGNNNRIIEPGEDIKRFTNLLYEDWFYEGYFDDYHTWSSDATLDGEGVASHSNQAIGDYTYEFKIPLNSGDVQDLAITSDSTIGLHIKYSEYYYDSIDYSWMCDGTEDGWPNNGDQFNGSNYGTLILNSSYTLPGYTEELVSITGQQTTPIIWNASNFDGFKYNSRNIQSTETLTIAPFTLNGPDIDRVIEAGNLTYTTSFVLNEYPIYKDLGLYVNNIDEGYSIGYLNGEQYVAINNANKLVTQLIEFDSNDVKTLKTGDVWNIGGGFSITVLQVDTDGNKVWIELDKNGAFLADKILETGRDLPSRVWTYDEDVAGESDIPILSLYVSGIMRGEDTAYIQIKYLSLIDNDVSEILSDDIFGNMEVISMTAESLGFSNWFDLNLSPSNSPSMIMENMSFITLDNLSSIEFYPSVVRNEIPILSGGGGFVSGNYSSLWDLSEGYTIALQEVDVEGEKAMFSLLEDGVIVDQKIMTERSIAPNNLDSNYQYIKNGTQIINATLDFAFHGSNSEIANLINVYQWSEVDSSILLSNESHIFKSTTSTGMPWNLSEGYTLTMKDVSLDADEVWFELSKNDVVVKDDILDEDALNISIYTSGNGNISYVLDSVFGGTNESVAKIRNVIQYSDMSGELLINNSTHLYKTGNPSGIPWFLPDGYSLSMKGVDRNSEEVWFELFKDGNSLKEDIVRLNAHFTYVNGLESFNCLVSGVMHGTLTDATKITGVNLYSDAGVQLVHNDSRMYTTSNPSGEIWQLFEGYSLDPKDVDVDGRKVWLSLSKDGTVVMDEIIDSWDNDVVRWFNYYNSSGELVFSTYVDDVFKGQVDYVVILENSKQYSEINGTLLLSIPKTTLRTGITLNDNENSAPVANNDTTTTFEDTSVDITLSATDVDGDSLTYSIVDAASNGTVTLSGNTATYTPIANFSGTDSFTFKANDGTVDSNTATVSITVLVGNAAEATEEAKLIAALDGKSGDYFGYSVAVNGDTAVIGAHGDDDAFGQSGSAYVFIRSGGTWIQQAKLNATDGTGNDHFGWSVSIDGDTVVIGAPFDYDKGIDSGSAYIFTRSGTTWTQQAKLNATDGAAVDKFGYSVSVDNNTAVISAWGDDQYSGSAYVFTRNGTTWEQQAKLNATDGARGDYFGRSVSVDDDTVVIGANYANDGAGHNSGSAYVFTRNGATWTQQAKLNANDGAAYDWFGVSVSVNADTAVIGAHWDDDKGIDSGSAYIFTRSGVTWMQQAKLKANDGDASDIFGVSVSVDGDTAIIGAYRDDDKGADSGSAYIFTRSGATWTQQAKLNANDGAAYDWFGYSVSVDSDTVVIGAPYDDDLGSYSGSAYVYSLGSTGGNAPVAFDDSYSVNENTVLNVIVPGVLGNDTDFEGDILNAVLVDNATNGILALNDDGSFSYTPNPDFNGADSFTYKANDGTFDSNTATVSITVTAVNDAPTVTILSPPAITNDSTPLLHATFDQIAASVWYVIDDGANETGESNTDNLTVILSEREDGQHTVKVYANNSDGKVGNATKVFLLDTITPAITIDNVTSPTNDSSQIITGTFNESGSGIDSITVNGVTATISDVNYSVIIGFTEGINLVDVIAVDNAGNSDSNSTTIVLDTIAPALTIDQVTSPTNVNSQIITGTFNESGSGIDSITVNGVMATISDANYSVIISLTEGINPVDVIAVDIAGNIGSNSTAIVLDTIAPALTINQVTSPTNDSSQIVGGTFNESDSGIDSITVNGAAASILGANYSAIIDLTEGTNPVDVIAVDIAGNIGLNSTTIVLDTIAPALTINQVTSPTNDSSQTITGTFNESGSDIDSIIVNGVNATISGANYSAPISLTEGTNSVDVIAVDIAGNSGSNSTTIVLDTIAPTANITAPQNNTEIKYFENIIKGNVFDEHFDSAVLKVNSGSDVSTYDLTITDNSFAQRVEFTPYQNNTLELVVFDTAGNSNNDTVLVFIRNNTLQEECDVSNNESTIIDAMDETDTMIEFHSNVTESNVTFTVTAITDQELVDEVNSSASVFGEAAMGKIVEINVTGLDATNESQVKYARIELCYTIDDLDLDGDGTVEFGELNEDNLFIYWCNETSGNWTKLLKDNPEWVLDNGQVKISESNPVGYVWVDVKHLSMFGLAAGSVPESTYDGDGNDGYVPPSSGGGGGGGSGSSGEAYGNIAVKEVIRNYVSVETRNTYQFEGDANAIGFVTFDAKTNAGYIAATVEVLKDTSSLVSSAPSGKVYQNMNIWVGTGGYATENNIANPIIGFKVAKSWINENDIDESTIELNRYSSGVWDQLPTTKTDEDGSYIYFNSETPGFSSFAITGDERSSTAAVDTDGPLFSPPSSTTDDDLDEPIGETANVPYDEAKSSSGLVLVIGLIVISVIVVGVYLRKNKN